MRQGIIAYLCIILHTYKLPLIICKHSDDTCVCGVTSMFFMCMIAAFLFNGFIMGFEYSVQLQLLFLKLSLYTFFVVVVFMTKHRNCFYFLKKSMNRILKWSQLLMRFTPVTFVSQAKHSGSRYYFGRQVYELRIWCHKFTIKI